MPELHEIISGNLRRIRREKGVSQAELSRASGIDERQISKIENRPESMSTHTVQRLCDGLGVPAEELVSSGKTEGDYKIPKRLLPGLEEAVRILRVHVAQGK